MTSAAAKTEERAGVRLTNLDEELFVGAQATKRDLVDYLDAVREEFRRSCSLSSGQPYTAQLNMYGVSYQAPVAVPSHVWVGLYSSRRVLTSVVGYHD